jgi:hypothetical protein
MSEIWQSAIGEALARAHKLRDFIEQDWIMPQLMAPQSPGRAQWFEPAFSRWVEAIFVEAKAKSLHLRPA